MRPPPNTHTHTYTHLPTIVTPLPCQVDVPMLQQLQPLAEARLADLLAEASDDNVSRSKKVRRPALLPWAAALLRVCACGCVSVWVGGVLLVQRLPLLPIPSHAPPPPPRAPGQDDQGDQGRGAGPPRAALHAARQVPGRLGGEGREGEGEGGERVWCGACGWAPACPTRRCPAANPAPSLTAAHDAHDQQPAAGAAGHATQRLRGPGAAAHGAGGGQVRPGPPGGAFRQAARCGGGWTCSLPHTRSPPPGAATRPPETAYRRPIAFWSGARARSRSRARMRTTTRPRSRWEGKVVSQGGEGTGLAARAPAPAASGPRPRACARCWRRQPRRHAAAPPPLTQVIFHPSHSPTFWEAHQAATMDAMFLPVARWVTLVGDEFRLYDALPILAKPLA